MNEKQTKRNFLAVVSGGIGPDVWDSEVEINGMLTISDALAEVEKSLEWTEHVIEIREIGT